MRILAIDSSGLVASVAVVEETETETVTVAEYTMNYKKTHSQTLLPMLDEMAAMVELDLETIDAIAVAGGPGSFTGLRIGVATAKGIGFALRKPLIHVPTLHGLAYNLWGAEGVICPMMDARRGQVYTGIFRFEEGKLLILEDQMAVPVEELSKRLKSYQQRIVFLGDGVPVHRRALEERLMTDCEIEFAPALANRQRAAALGTLAVQYYHEGKLQSAEEFQPDYLRASQAERERAQKELRKEAGERADCTN